MTGERKQGMKWKNNRLLRLLFIVVLTGLVYFVVTEWWAHPRSHRAPDNRTISIPRPSIQGRKQVRFRPTVTVASAGGVKSDRFNPDLRSGVARNANLAARVGGARRLAQLSLLEAASSSASSASSEEA